MHQEALATTSSFAVLVDKARGFAERIDQSEVAASGHRVISALKQAELVTKG